MISMADVGDIVTLGFKGNGLRYNNETVLLTLEKGILEYLGVTAKELETEEIKLVLKFDKGKHGKFVGVGIKD